MQGRAIKEDSGGQAISIGLISGDEHNLDDLQTVNKVIIRRFFDTFGTESPRWVWRACECIQNDRI